MHERIALLECERDDWRWQFERMSYPDAEELYERAAQIAADFGISLHD